MRLKTYHQIVHETTLKIYTMSSRGWRILRLRPRSYTYPSKDQFVGHLQRLQQKASIASTENHFFLFQQPRNISSSSVDRRSSANGTGSGGPREPVDESLARDDDESQAAGDRRMWRKWIEERLAHSKKGEAGEELASTSSSAAFEAETKPSSFSASSIVEETDSSLISGPAIKETVRGTAVKGSVLSLRTSLKGDKGNVDKKSPLWDSFFKIALKPPTNAASENTEESKAANFKNPFRRDIPKSKFFPDKEPSKNTSFSSTRSSFFQDAAKRSSFVPEKQIPGRTPQEPMDDLPVEALDEFEYRVLGSANDVDDSRDDDFLRELDEIGRSARGIRDEADDLRADDDEDWGNGKIKVLTDLALSNLEEFDLEDEERPYRMRSDRLFFPGQTYDPEDLDLSKEVAELDKPTSRIRKKYPPKEVYQIADFRNPRYLSNFIRESSRILPKRHFQLSAKAQRKVAREIKTARILGLMPFTSMGDPPFRFLRSRSEEDFSARSDDD